MRRIFSFQLFVYAGLLFAYGCGDSSTGGPGGGTPDDPDAIGFSDTHVAADEGTPEPDTFTPPTDNDKLDFVADQGDDGKKCKGTDRCAVFMSFNGERTLEVKATRAGKVIDGLQIDWEITKNKSNSLSLGSKVSFTGNAGTTSNTVKQTAAQEFQYEVKVFIKDSNAAPLFYDVVVTPKGTVPLIVAYNYAGTRSFQGVTTYLFKNETPQKALKCAEINPANLPTADITGPPKALNQTTAFPSLPGLQEDGTQHYTVVGIGKDTTGPVLVWGCDDTNALVQYIGSKQVDVALNDLPPTWKGKYDITTKFDLVSLLPENVANVVNIVLGLFADPPGQLLVLVCQFGADVGVIGDLCGFVFADPDNPCLEDTCFEGVGLAIKKIITDFLYDLIKDNVAGDILFTGQDIAKILKQLELLSTIEFVEEPAADGTFTDAAATIEWHTVRYRWTLGGDCNPQDPNDCWRQFSVNAFQGGTIKGKFSGKVIYNGNDNFVQINEFPLNIKYGALLNFIIKNEILPLIGGDGTDGGVKIDTYAEFLKSLLGGKECLKWEIDNSIDKTCCDQFAEDIASGGGVTNTLAQAACQAGVPILEEQLNKLLDDLDIDSGDGFTLATDETGCQCYDHDANLTIDTWGALDKPCTWITKLAIGGGASIDNKFWGSEQQ